MKETSIECTHCRVVMTSWSAPGSTIRYFQCPFCHRTHSSLYGEVFRRRAGARVVEAPRGGAATAQGIPMATADEMRWARVKQTASRWFARLEAEEERCTAMSAPPLRSANAPLPAPADVPEVAPDDVELVQVAPATRRRR